MTATNKKLNIKEELARARECLRSADLLKLLCEGHQAFWDEATDARIARQRTSALLARHGK